MSRSHSAVLLAAVCFGTTGTAQALGPAAASPATVGAIRIAVGAGLLALVLVAVRGAKPAARDFVPLAVAALGVALYQLCFFAAVSETGVAVGTVVALGSAPALTGALGWLARGSRPGAAWAWATALATIGVALLMMEGGDDEVSSLGVVLAVGAGTAYAAFTLGSKRMLDDGRRVEEVMAWAFGSGAVLLAPVGLMGDLRWLADPAGVAMALWLGAVATAAAYLLFAAGLRNLAAQDVATLTLAEPMTAFALGVVVLAERPTAMALAGVGLVLGGLLLIVGAPAPRHRGRT